MKLKEHMGNGIEIDQARFSKTQILQRVVVATTAYFYAKGAINHSTKRRKSFRK